MNSYLLQLISNYKLLVNKIHADNKAYENYPQLKNDYELNEPAAYNVKRGKNDMDIFIDTFIDPFFLDVQGLTREITLNKARNITAHINSPGGDVVSGIALYSTLRQQADKGVNVVAINEGCLLYTSPSPRD